MIQNEVSLSTIVPTQKPATPYYKRQLSFKKRRNVIKKKMLHLLKKHVTSFFERPNVF